MHTVPPETVGPQERRSCRRRWGQRTAGPRGGIIPGPCCLEPGLDLTVVDLGRIPYARAFALQKALGEARRADEVGDVLLLLEHPHTITHSHSGRGRENLLATPEQLAERGVVVEPTDRGGNITFHGPGQLVAYPVLQLVDGEQDLHGYLRRLEAVILQVCERFGFTGARVSGRTGIWRPDGSAKIAAIGVHTSRWITRHGFALNVDVDLGFFDLIVPCGIDDAGVTSLAKEVAHPPAMAAVVAAVSEVFPRVFERAPVGPSDALLSLLRAHGALPAEAC
jgi:lipoyl(octanoyl) transferase